MSVLTDHLPPNAAGLKLYRYDSKDRLIGCESVLFVDGFPAVETTLRRARIAGRAEVGGDIDKHFADVLDKDGGWIGDSVALDRASYSALKNRWMRCKTEDLDNVLGRRKRSFDRAAVAQLLRDPEVAEWIAVMHAMALLPRKRKP